MTHARASNSALRCPFSFNILIHSEKKSMKSCIIIQTQQQTNPKHTSSQIMKYTQIYYSLNVPSLPSPHHWSCFRYLLLCMARHAGSSTARDYCQCNWLFQAWFDMSLLSDPHTSLLSSVMERRWGSHETFASSYLQRNHLSRFVYTLRGQSRK